MLLGRFYGDPTPEIDVVVYGISSKGRARRAAMQIGIEGNQPFRKSRLHCKVDGRGENRLIYVKREACISALTFFLGCLGNQRQWIRGRLIGSRELGAYEAFCCGN